MQLHFFLQFLYIWIFLWNLFSNLLHVPFSKDHCCDIFYFISPFPFLTFWGSFLLYLPLLQDNFLCFCLFYLVGLLIPLRRILVTLIMMLIFLWFMFISLLILSTGFTMLRSVLLFFFCCVVPCYIQWSHPFCRPFLYLHCKIMFNHHIWQGMPFLVCIPAHLYVHFVKICFELGYRAIFLI